MISVGGLGEMEPGITGGHMASAVVAPLVQRLFARRDAELADRPARLTELVAFRGERRTLSDEDVLEICGKLVEHGWGEERPDGPLSADERAAGALALAHALSALADLDMDDVEAVRLEHRELAYLLASNPGWRRGVEWARGSAETPQTLLAVVCLHIQHLWCRQSPYVTRTLADRARSVARLVEKEDELHQDQVYEHRYLRAVAMRHSRLTLFGADLPPELSSWPLDRAYVSLRAEGTEAGHRVRMSAEGLLETHQRVFLRGAAGSGKTTLVWALASAAVRNGFGPRCEYLRGRIPFVLSLRSLRGDALPTPEQLIAHTAPVRGKTPAGWASRVLDAGRALVLIDGVDEAPHGLHESLRVWISNLVRIHPENLYLVTARSSATPDDWLASAGFVERDLLPLQESDVARFIRTWHAAVDPADSDPAEAQHLIDMVDSRRDFPWPVTNPLLCALMCAAHMGRGAFLTQRQTDLYEAALSMLLSRRDRERGIGASDGVISERHLAVFLKVLAYWLIRNGREGMPRGTALNLIATRLPTVHLTKPSEEILRQLVVRSGFLYESTGDLISFPHTAFRDYLVAQAAVEGGDFGELGFHALDDAWWDVICHAVAVARPHERADLLTYLVERGDAEPRRVDRTRIYALAARAMQRADELAPHVRGAVESRLASVLPPHTVDEARALELMGRAVFALLPRPEDTSAEQAKAVVAMAHRIGGAGSEEVVRRFGVRIVLPPTAEPDVIATLPDRSPRGPEIPDGAKTLAIALSVATRIEPELIRAVRLRVFPRLDAGDEADLWFSHWVAARTRRAMALRPELLPELRAELARRLADSAPDDPIRTVGEVIAEVHAQLSPALLMEERVNWIDVSPELDRADALEDALRPALRALVAERRDGIADWLAGAWKRLPESARNTVTGWQLVTSAAHRVPDLRLAPVAAPERLSSTDVAVLVDVVPEVALPVRRLDGQLLLGSVTGTGTVAIPVPDTQPRLVEVLLGDGGPVRAVTVPADEVRTVEVGDGPVRLRTPGGAVYELLPGVDAELMPEAECQPPGRTGGDRGESAGPLRPEGMLLRASAREVAAMVAADALGTQMERAYARVHTRSPQPFQRRFWERSLAALVDLLIDAGLAEAELLLEYTLPSTNACVDAVIAGWHPGTGEPSYVVVELTGWSSASALEGDPARCVVGGFRRPRLHPVTRVQSYCGYFAAHHAALASHPWRVRGMAYLFNAGEFAIADLRQLPGSEQGAMFTTEGRGAAVDFLRSFLGPEPGAAAADELLSAPPRSLPGVLSLVEPAVLGRSETVLLDEQRVALAEVLHLVRRAYRADHKEVVVVTGGPGSGKTAIALSLLGELRQQGLQVRFASGSRALVEALRRAADSADRRARDLFTYFNAFMALDRNELDVLLCDEAQDIRETSAGRYTPRRLRTGERSQTEELMDAARVPVFLLDESQAVAPAAVGSHAMIASAAEARGLHVRHVDLTGLFRHGGSRRYADWVDALLKPAGPGLTWAPDEGRYTVLVADAPARMEEFLRQRLEQGYTSCLTAGFCWPVTTQQKGAHPAADVQIGDWHRPWQSAASPAAGVPSGAERPMEPAGLDQVSAVYNVQGLEFDWCGVIFGPDLVWRGDRWIVDRSASRQPVYRVRDATDAEVHRLVRNTYRILLTRGVHGTVVYSTDPETRERLRQLAPSLSGEFQEWHRGSQGH
ncbi:DNA/RNA helicase domain-containing protein [Streptomyces sp. NEAU-S7GS2]|uniref:DNA/RNA helicase domain-containing protein n=1 Tax=Streptomyces sp. NEAU-S7GS2 TaxID=2202000 RepID=UPI000D6EDDDF|nr:DNA/RNA helicase domain-containing protein [Streptomyces sp. NEAU-S7GS2]AWN25953.1 hypothetical protein DKG71_07465 [Streptomyces sp. NEAU-S7GS2]